MQRSHDAMNDAQRKIVETLAEEFGQWPDEWFVFSGARENMGYQHGELAIALRALLAQSTPPPAREIVKIPAIDSELVRRLYAAEEDYTTEWGSGELYGQAADAMRRLIWALHWVATRSTNGLLMAPRDLPMEGFVRDEIAAVDAAPDSAAPPTSCVEYERCLTPEICVAQGHCSYAAAQADAPEGSK
jgi:hypothetical protein